MTDFPFLSSIFTSHHQTCYRLLDCCDAGEAEEVTRRGRRTGTEESQTHGETVQTAEEGPGEDKVILCTTTLASFPVQRNVIWE